MQATKCWHSDSEVLVQLRDDVNFRSNEDGNEAGRADNGNDDDDGAFSSSDEAEFADAASSLVEAVYSASSQSSVGDDDHRDREMPATPKRYDFESCAPRRIEK